MGESRTEYLTSFTIQFCLSSSTACMRIAPHALKATKPFDREKLDRWIQSAK